MGNADLMEGRAGRCTLLTWKPPVKNGREVVEHHEGMLFLALLIISYEILEQVTAFCQTLRQDLSNSWNC